MTAWANIRRVGVGAVLLFLLVPRSPAAPDPTRAERKPDPVAQLRAKAESAEKAGDWEAAFAAYCRLHVLDRTTPDVREKLNNALRRVQQSRRHADPAFRQFAGSLPVADALNLFAEVVAKVPAVYADADRATPQHLWAHAAEELDRALASPAFREAFLDNPPADRVEAFRASLRTFWAKRPVGTARDARSVLKQLLSAMQDTFPVRVPSAVALEFVCGACSGLDEYTVFLQPGSLAADPTAAPDLTGYGVSLLATDTGLVVDAVAPMSWAALNTTLQKGDRVVRVNGRPADMPGAATEALRTPIDGFHELEVAPPIPDVPAAVVRLPVIVPTVYRAAMLNTREGIGYVRVGAFGPTTPREIDDAILRLKAGGMRALVLDLRGNHGGSFLAAVEVAKRFLPAGIVVTTHGQLGEVAGRVFSSDSGMAAHGFPVVVLIDAETASAAEVVAAALKDNGRAEVIGMPSFGKGAVQYPLKLTTLDADDGMGQPRPRSGAVRVTIAKLVSPRGTAINGVGIAPHFVEPDPARQLDLAVERAADLLSPMPRSPMPMPHMQE